MCFSKKRNRQRVVDQPIRFVGAAPVGASHHSRWSVDGGHTGIVGATVVTLGMIALPVMVDKHYDPKSPQVPLRPPACWANSFLLPYRSCCWGTFYQWLPTSTSEYGYLCPKTVSVGDLFAGLSSPAHFGGFVPVYILIVSVIYPSKMPSTAKNAFDVRATITALFLR